MNRRALLASIGAGIGGVGAGWFVLSGRSVGYRVAIEHEAIESDAPLVVDARLDDTNAGPRDPAVFSFSIRNEGADVFEVGSGAPAPFGILQASKLGSDRELTLWSEAYERSEHVSTFAGLIVGGDDIGLVSELEPEETVTERYELRRLSLAEGPGTYVLSTSYGVEPLAPEITDEDRAGYGPLSYELRFSVG